MVGTPETQISILKFNRGVTPFPGKFDPIFAKCMDSEDCIIYIYNKLAGDQGFHYTKERL
jgi:hypothetical protein